MQHEATSPSQRIALGPSLSNFVEEGTMVALAVSGGSDSLGLLHLAVERLGSEKLRVLTVDHCLREGSQVEAEQVGRWAAALGVTHHILTWQGEKPATGIQAKARVARYDLMTAWCKAHGVAVLLTAHTLDDQAETVKMRAARTDSARSLAGIWPETTWNDVRIVRPLLHMRREQLRDFLRARDISWIDDPSNENRRFERVRIRHDMVPADVTALASRAVESQMATAGNDGLAKDWLRGFAQIAPTGLVTLPRLAFSALAGDVAEATLRWAVMAAGSGRPPERRALLDLLARLRGAGSSRMTLAGAVVVARKRDILVGREPGRIDAGHLVVPASGRLLWDGRFVIEAPAGALVFPAGIGCPRPEKALPAFVLAGLPMVQNGDEMPKLPHFHATPGVAVGLCERFRL